MTSGFAAPWRRYRSCAHLTRSERELLAAAAAGEIAGPAECPFDLAANAWGPDRTVRAAVLRHLLISDDWPVDAKGVRIQGVEISGHLDLEAATLRCPLRLEDCYLSSVVPVKLDCARASLLALTGCRLGGLTGDALVVTNGLDLHGSTFTGQLLLTDADITGGLDFRGGKLEVSGPNGALVADRMKVNGSVFLSRSLSREFTAAGTVRLAGADITGQLNLAGARLSASGNGGDALIADGMKVGGNVFLDNGFTAVGTVRLPGADIGGLLSCTQAQLDGKDKYGRAFAASRMKVGTDVDLAGVHTTATAGAIRMTGADITGELKCSGAQLEGTDEHGNALVADSIKVGGRVLLDELTAAGTVWLPGAVITGRLLCRGAVLNGNEEHGAALLADQMRVGGGVILDDVRTTAGGIQMVGADITGVLRCNGAQLEGKDRVGNSLLADSMKVSDSMYLGASDRNSAEGRAFNAQGAVSLRSARIGGSLHLEPSGLAGSTDKGGTHQTALNATGAHIAHTLHWAPSGQVKGLVSLEYVQAGQLEDHWTDAGEQVNGCWPSAEAGVLRLDGFTYAGFGGNQQATAEQRLAWIRSQYRQKAVVGWTDTLASDGSASARARARSQSDPTITDLGVRFATQPYEQLAIVYREAGQDAEARAVAIARRRDLREYGDLTGYRRAVNWLLDKTIRYGYQTGRAVVMQTALYVAALVFFWFARYHGAIIPTQNVPGLTTTPMAAQCTSFYPCFNPFGYAVDTVIPLINVHQADFWGPNASVPWGVACVVVTYLGTVLGGSSPRWPSQATQGWSARQMPSDLRPAGSCLASGRAGRTPMSVQRRISLSTPSKAHPGRAMCPFGYRVAESITESQLRGAVKGMITSRTHPHLPVTEGRQRGMSAHPPRRKITNNHATWTWTQSRLSAGNPGTAGP